MMSILQTPFSTRTSVFLSYNEFPVSPDSPRKRVSCVEQGDHEISRKYVSHDQISTELVPLFTKGFERTHYSHGTTLDRMWVLC